MTVRPMSFFEYTLQLPYYSFTGSIKKSVWSCLELVGMFASSLRPLKGQVLALASHLAMPNLRHVWWSWHFQMAAQSRTCILARGFSLVNRTSTREFSRGNFLDCGTSFSNALKEELFNSIATILFPAERITSACSRGSEITVPRCKTRYFDCKKRHFACKERYIDCKERYFDCKNR